MQWLIVLIVLVAVVGLVAWGARTFRPEIDRARRIRRAQRNGELDR